MKWLITFLFLFSDSPYNFPLAEKGETNTNMDLDRGKENARWFTLCHRHKVNKICDEMYVDILSQIKLCGVWLE